MNRLYVCSNHRPLGEIMAGAGTAAQFRQTPCTLCEIARLRGRISTSASHIEAGDNMQALRVLNNALPTGE